MQYFVKKHLDENEILDILEVGSYDVNGAYKLLFDFPNWNYFGLDIVEGPNVDFVSKSDYNFGLDKQYDVIVSGNCMEHVEAPWKWVKEIEKATKKGGLVCTITPFSIGEHRYPVDCWRILPDGYKYLLEKVTDFSVLESKINNATIITKYRFFGTRPYLKWFYNMLPNRIKKYFIYTIHPTQDTFVIARKN
jgi:SAM-dependent methyltransferase